ncbi:hypothetical protein D0962_16125 [Leptolyngbyaceae cyanobacterium CCMR0082]|uniref:Uncharacterized protein n=1 Tax=Adonisia turfae CCMR0082 TaxID=2304604 RepID=A0A6M0S7F0_9CYAN|nr:pectinesterase family protein [Adonisia turfae]NEZ64300.1 hypothetical protein [Adonisia turfae CCMR0082]
MFFYILVAILSGLETSAYPHISHPTEIVSSVTIADNSTARSSTTIDITNLPPEVFEANPGLDNAVANDGRDDSTTIQAAINWLTAESRADTTATLYIPEGVFDLAKTLNVNRANIVFKGAGRGRTVLQNRSSFKVGTQGLPDGETVFDSIDQNAYLFSLKKTANNVSFTNMTLTGPEIHGAIFSGRNQGLVLKNLEFKDFLWSSVRLFQVKNATIHDNIFIDAGGQGHGDSGITSGSIFATYLKDSEIYNNDISKSGQRNINVYGIKGRQFRNVRISNNSIKTDFSIELPFENDRFVEIDHNYLSGTISIPKFGGGNIPEDGFTFHIHHNYFTSSYSLEWARNGAEINNNVFVFDTGKDHGNLISNFGEEPANGPTKFHNNLIVNPGRGVVWHKGIYNNFSFYNNEVIANQTETPRKAGLFGFHKKTDFSTIEIKDNLIRVNGISRPLMRNQDSYRAVIENNKLINIADVNDFNNPETGSPQGLLEPLNFRVGVNGEFTVNGTELSATHSETTTAMSQDDPGMPGSPRGRQWSPRQFVASWLKWVGAMVTG